MDYHQKGLYFWEMKLMKKESALFKKDYFEYNFLLGGTPTIFLCYGAPKNPRLFVYKPQNDQKPCKSLNGHNFATVAYCKQRRERCPMYFLPR